MKFTSIMWIFVDFVNLVNYKILMNNKNKKIQQKSQEISADNTNNQSSGIYLRDDHCDWGSSGMNEFTNEYSEND